MMTQAKYDKIMEAALRQREEVSQSREAARKLLTDLGIYHLFVPAENNKKKKLPRAK